MTWKGIFLLSAAPQRSRAHKCTPRSITPRPLFLADSRSSRPSNLTNDPKSLFGKTQASKVSNIAIPLDLKFSKTLSDNSLSVRLGKQALIFSLTILRLFPATMKPNIPNVSPNAQRAFSGKRQNKLRNPILIHSIQYLGNIRRKFRKRGVSTVITISVFFRGLK